MDKTKREADGMLDAKFQRGFSSERLSSTREPKVRKDENGYYIMSLSENAKVYFEDFYGFLRATYEKSRREKEITRIKLMQTPASAEETQAFYRARLVVIDLLMRTILRFYTDGSNLGVVMTPWCFGTVVLEKIEVYRDRLSKGEVEDPNIPNYPYYVIKYIDEIYKIALLELFDFPEQAFQMRWQYSELLKRYSRILNDITSSLQSVIQSVKNIGT
jgi:hypothetical protein